MTGRVRSSDGVMSSTDLAAVALWESIGARMAQEQAAWSDILRAMGVKLEHPDDGWVDRDSNRFTLSWYARFDLGPEVGDLIAFGCPPDGEHYRSWRDVYATHSDAERRAHYESKPESAADGYRICRVTSVDRRRGILGHHQRFDYVDTGQRVPPRAPAMPWWRRWRRSA